ncbi:MAG: hypothetical protein ISS71_06415 [Phycisphaerae bacterium]|nr:hypothetical protein [Phycisphaerae bacterium]
MKVYTSNGSIKCEDISGQLTAVTSNGKIHAGIPFTVQGEIAKILKGAINESEAQLYLRISNSSIHIN